MKKKVKCCRYRSQSTFLGLLHVNVKQLKNKTIQAIFFPKTVLTLLSVPKNLISFTVSVWSRSCSSLPPTAPYCSSSCYHCYPDSPSLAPVSAPACPSSSLDSPAHLLHTTDMFIHPTTPPTSLHLNHLYAA